MKNFLYKEFKLCLTPINYFYLLFLTMLIIPNYPKYVGFFFLCVSLLYIFINAELNKDIQYSMILPINKRDMVKSRCILVCAYQILGIIISVPLSFLAPIISPSGNVAGIEANAACYGLTFILFAIFDFVFFTQYYKKAEKPGIPFLFAGITFWIFYAIFEIPIWGKDSFGVEYFKIMDKIDFKSQIKQLPIFFAGLIIYFAGWILTYKVSAKRFEKADL